MEILKLIIVLIAGGAASFLGTTAGGCGLISIPVLVFVGLSAQAAVATAKLGALGLILSGLYRFHKGGKINYKIGIPLAFFSFVGAYFGANTLVNISSELLGKYLGLVILVVLPMLFVRKDVGLKKKKRKNWLFEAIGYLLFLPLGFWGGFFGPGYAILSTYALIFLFGQTFLESAGTRKILGLGVTVLSLVIFAKNGLLNWTYGSVVFLGMVFGSYLGASYGIKKGDEWVRRLFILIVIISALKLIL
jgi:uncharacterized membrane protein YfcA